MVDGISERLTHALISENWVVALINRLTLIIQTVLRVLRVCDIKDDIVPTSRRSFVILNLAFFTELLEIGLLVFWHARNQGYVTLEELLNTYKLIGNLLVDVCLWHDI